MKAVTQQSATELLALLRTKKISALELAEEYIRQIERVNPQINALVDFDPERVRQQARVSENSSAKLGLLAGLPVTVKSSISTAGHRCEIGSLVNRGHIPAQDATVVARLRQAGAIILGTTNCPEYLMAYVTENDLHGRTNNPWNFDYTPGGSSGGESAAIAAGMSAGGLGSDSGGSVRVPAHFTGICSLKPTPGRIPGRRSFAAVHWAVLVPGRHWPHGPDRSTTSRCCFARSRDKTLSIPPVHPSHCASRPSTRSSAWLSVISKTTA